ncbi:DUF6622 family protein [Caenimonas terrae]|uniref:DUF6622 family protein n=1 Tax=Caenimonas terrae TaxID=696074 RepID=A0ABW0NG52_9BURK
MLIQMLIARPQTIGPILSNTPTWVWALLAGLLWLGASMLRSNTVSAVRVGVMPVAMTGLSLWGAVSAFSHSVIYGYVMLAWVVAAVVLATAVGSMQPPRGSSYNPQERTFTVPGSWVPLALILGIFLVKYVVGVEVAMNPALAQDASYSLTYGVIYGAFSGIFSGRSIRLARLARRTAPASVSTARA